MTKTEADDVIVSRPGRPRRFGAEEERQRIFDAAFEVMRRNGYGDVTVGDILAEADMSTRSFYRHFESKDALLAALFRQDAQQFARAVTARVQTAPDPRTAVDVWIDEILAFGLGRGRARRAAVLGSPAAMASLSLDVLRDARELLIAPLIAILDDGIAAAIFEAFATSSEARADALRFTQSLKPSVTLDAVDSLKAFAKPVLLAWGGQRQAVPARARPAPRSGLPRRDGQGHRRGQHIRDAGPTRGAGERDHPVQRGSNSAMGHRPLDPVARPGHGVHLLHPAIATTNHGPRCARCLATSHQWARGDLNPHVLSDTGT